MCPQDATGIEDIDQLVNTFLAAEDQNYTLFNYVNEVNQEIEKLEDQINIMRSEINKVGAGDHAKADAAGAAVMPRPHNCCAFREVSVLGLTLYSSCARVRRHTQRGH